MEIPIYACEFQNVRQLLPLSSSLCKEPEHENRDPQR